MAEARHTLSAAKKYIPKCVVFDDIVRGDIRGVGPKRVH